MHELSTDKISVEALSEYQPQFSRPGRGQYIFTYAVKIRNDGSRPAQLMSRRWRVIDGTGQVRKVVGEGVVGQQPVIEAGQTYEYNSWIQFATPIGAMDGSYLMRPTEGEGAPFEATIPRFVHLAAELLN